MLSRDQMIEIVSRYGAAKNRHDIASALETCSEDFFLEIAPFGTRIVGKDYVRTHLERFFEAFPDHVAARELVACGDDAVVSLWRMRGTMRGRFFGMSPTGRVIDVPTISVFQFNNGALAGERVFYDVATLCRQAGLPIPRAALEQTDAIQPAASAVSTV